MQEVSKVAVGGFRRRYVGIQIPGKPASKECQPGDGHSIWAPGGVAAVRSTPLALVSTRFLARVQKL